MAYLPDGVPRPEPTMDDRPFWENCNQRRLTFQRCADCGRCRHPPTPLCPSCQSTGVSWAEAPARGRLFTYTIVHHAAHPAVRERLPYNVAVVEFPELDGVRLISNVIDAAPADLVIGMPLQLVWDAVGDGVFLPRFLKAA